MALIYKLGVASDSSHSGATHTTFDIFAKYAVFDASGNQIRVNDSLGNNFTDFNSIVAPGQYSGICSIPFPDETGAIGSFALLVTLYSQWIDTDQNIYRRRISENNFSAWEKIPLMSCNNMTWAANTANYISLRSGQLEFFENAIGYSQSSDSAWIRFISSTTDPEGDHDIEFGLADDGMGRAVVRRQKYNSGNETTTDKEVFLLDKNGNTAVENLLIRSGHGYSNGAFAISYDGTNAPKFAFNSLNFLLPTSYTASGVSNETIATREYIQNAALQFNNYTHGTQFRVGTVSGQPPELVDRWTKNNNVLIPGYYVFNANDDFVFLTGGGTHDFGYGILGTGDNGNEPIYVAQFDTTNAESWGTTKGVNDIANAKKYITLLDANGYTKLGRLYVGSQDLQSNLVEINDGAIIAPKFSLGSGGNNLVYYNTTNVYGLGINLASETSDSPRGIFVDREWQSQGKALLRFNSPDYSFILGQAGTGKSGWKYVGFGDNSFKEGQTDITYIASEDYVQNYAKKNQTYTWTTGSISGGKRVLLGQFIKTPSDTGNGSALHITGTCGTWQAAGNRCIFDFIIGNRLDSNTDLRRGVKGYIKGNTGSNIHFYLTKSDPNNPDSADLLYLEYSSFPLISFTIECSIQFNINPRLVNEADLSTDVGMSQSTVDFDLSEQDDENTTTAVRIFKELQVLDATATVTTDGLMSAADKTKLEGIKEVTSTSSGLMTKDQKIKLDGINVKSVTFSAEEAFAATPIARQVTVTKSDGTDIFQFASSEVKNVSFSDQEVTTAIKTARQVTVTKPDGSQDQFQFASSESPIVEYLTATIDGDELVLTTTTGHVSNTRYLTAEVQNNILYFKEGD